jgi:hypothetical protein
LNSASGAACVAGILHQVDKHLLKLSQLQLGVYSSFIAHNVTATLRLGSRAGSPGKRAVALDEIFQVSRALANGVENKRKLFNPKT